jgi:hypothetical protein
LEETMCHPFLFFTFC